MNKRIIKSVLVLGFLFLAKQESSAQSTIAESLVFHSSFDQGVIADRAKGDKELWHSSAMDKRDQAQVGLPKSGEVVVEPSGGRFGGSIRFLKAKGPMVFYRLRNNFPEPKDPWNGSVSFWLRTNPASDLAEGFCDPIQITSKQWDDAAFFVEFEKRPSGIPFRLGVYANKNVWNPTGKKFELIPPQDRPLATASSEPFAKGQWTHVAFTFREFNTTGSQAVATLYLNGSNVGEISNRPQRFEWNIDKGAIMLGLGYVGSMDDLAIFDRQLSDEEVNRLYALPHGVQGLFSTTNSK